MDYVSWVEIVQKAYSYAYSTYVVLYFFRRVH